MLKFKIVLVPFPFDDLSGSKVRTCICLTEPIGTYKHVIVAFITTQIAHATEPSDLHLLKSDTSFASTGLHASSAIRLHRVATLPMHLFQRQLGVLPIDYQEEFHTKLKDLLKLD
jgi:mRNA interferase MazF